jgi:hypothetical protein
MIRFFAAFFIIFFSSTVFGQSFAVKKPLEISPGLLNQIHSDEEETPGRRAEIVFLISLPFTAIVSFALFNGIYLLTDPGYSFAMVSLPREILPFSIITALATSGMITYNDYVLEQKRRKDATSNSETSEFKMGMSLQKKF